MSLKQKLDFVRGGGATEDHEQRCVIEWAALVKVPRGAMAGRKLGEFLFAIPNGAHLSGSPGQRAAQMARLKKAGLMVGVSDLFLSLPASARHGLYIEMKRIGPGKVSEEQTEFATKMMQAGYCVALCRGFERAKAAIEQYLSGQGVPADLCFPIDWAKVAASVDRDSGSA